MENRQIPNPSDHEPTTPEQVEGRDELEHIMPAGPAVPVPASMMKPALEGSLLLAIAGAIIGLAIGFVAVAGFETDRSVLWISAIIGAVAGSVYGFVLGGTIGGTHEDEEDRQGMMGKGPRTHP